MRTLGLTLLFCAFAWTATGTTRGADLAAQFRRPPDSARPWVYCFWLEGNVTREGITADLEAMRRAGIGGLLFMDGAMGNPVGPHRFMSDSWRAMFRHMVAECQRLGLEINLNNDPGWAGSGGPWIKPEQASQKVVISETIVSGPAHFDAVLPQPRTTGDFYRDIVVLACPAPAPGPDGQIRRIENFDSTKSFAGDQDFAGCVPWPREIATNPHWPVVPAQQCIASGKVQDISDRMDAQGHLKWDAPAGRWVVLRIGHTVAGGVTRSAQAEANGWECDKLSKAAVETQFTNMVGKLLADVGPHANNTIVSTHIDSWEAGSGNWTDGFREEFRRRRGYDLLPYLPTLNGLLVDSLEVSERFLWDLRETVCEMLLENYAGHLKKLAHQKGLRLSIEGYDGTCDDLRFIGRADEPMCEFWQRGCYSGLPLCDIVNEVSSAAHVYGRKIVAAEAFTNWHGDFLDHPATLKPLGDWAFCAGVNRYCFSEWIVQPWPDRTPGVSFLFIGTVFHRSLTWWEQSRPWHKYVARCQHMLRQGQPVADILYLQAEGAPHRFVAPIPVDECGMIPDRRWFNYDGCPAELLQRATVKDGEIVLPSGMRYRLLVLPTYNADSIPVLHVEGNYVYTASPLPKVETMTPELLRHVKRLAEAGATVFGTRPLKSPSLANYPECDREVTRLADELWGKDAGRNGSGEHRVGRGRVAWGYPPDETLITMGVGPDFGCDLDLYGTLFYTHRRCDDGTEIYFVANKIDGVVQGMCRFRASKPCPELWHPATGRTGRVMTYQRFQGGTLLWLRLEPHESVFVVFRANRQQTARAIPHSIVSVTRNGKDIFAMTPDTTKIVVKKASYGVLGDLGRTRDVTARVQSIVNAGERRFEAWRLGEGDDPAPQTMKTLAVDYTINGQPRHTTVLDGQTICLGEVIDPLPIANVTATADGNLSLEAWQNGRYELKTASGRTLQCNVDNIPAPQPIDGPWEVRFPAFATQQSRLSLRESSATFAERKATMTSGGAPASIKLDKLTSWTDNADSNVKYFSGTATYRKTFNLPADALAAGRSIYLDLGKVAIIARVNVNGHDLGILWNTPFRIDATKTLKAGENTLGVQVTNLPVNRMIGDEQLPEDSERNPDGQLKSWPKWLTEGKPSPAGRHTFATYRVWKRDSPLQESGLLGPVKLYTTQQVTP
jgi:hypothetical protein